MGQGRPRRHELCHRCLQLPLPHLFDRAKNPVRDKVTSRQHNPAIATTNAIVAGLIVLQALKVLQKNVAACKTVYVRVKPSCNRVIVGTELVRPNEKCYVCAKKSEIRIKVNTSAMTVKQLRYCNKSCIWFSRTLRLKALGPLIFLRSQGKLTRIMASFYRRLDWPIRVCWNVMTFFRTMSLKLFYCSGWFFSIFGILISMRGICLAKNWDVCDLRYHRLTKGTELNKVNSFVFGSARINFIDRRGHRLVSRYNTTFWLLVLQFFLHISKN